jgi:phytoene dehydrogenase-like protein
VIATDGPAAQALLGDLAGAAAIPSGSLGTTLVYLHGSERLYGGAKLVLNAAADAVVNNVQMLSNVAASYAPAGRHLLSATLIGVPSADSDEQVFRSVRSDLERMFAADRAALAALRSYEPLRIYRIRHAQFPQPPGARLPGVRGAVPGLYYAAEWTESSSIHGAMRSGERCAAAIVSDQQAG